MSQPELPKQFLTIFKNKSLINQTIDRLKGYFKQGERILIIPQQLKKITMDFVGKEEFIIEPVRRNTAPAICLAAMILKKKYGDGILHVMPADHIISPKDDFVAALKLGEQFARKGYLVTYGIQPSRPETGYGYIRVGKRIGDHQELKAYHGQGFTEKPTLVKAKKYLRTGKYLWNAGIFTFGMNAVLKEIKKFIPEVYDGVKKYLQTKNKRQFSIVPDISIDYGIMEKSNSICIVKGDFDWDDVGSWLALERYFKKDKNNNILIGNALGLEMNDSIVYTYGTPVKVYGVSGLIVVVSPFGTLVCKKDRAANLKNLLRLDKKGG